MYTEEELLRAYRLGASDGIGISSPNDVRYMMSIDKTQKRNKTLNKIIG